MRGRTQGLVDEGRGGWKNSYHVLLADSVQELQVRVLVLVVWLAVLLWLWTLCKALDSMVSFDGLFAAMVGFVQP